MKPVDKIKEIVLKIMPKTDESAIKPESRFQDDLGADSLDMAEIMCSLEEEFGVEFPDYAEDKIITIKDAIQVIEQQSKRGEHTYE